MKNTGYFLTSPNSCTTCWNRTPRNCICSL